MIQATTNLTRTGSGGGNGKGELFRRGRHILEKALRDTVWQSSSENLGYIREFLLACRSEQPIEIATLNYDNCIELAASELGMSVCTGVSNAEADLNNELSFTKSRKDISLVKIHGSANWTFAGNGAREASEEQMRENSHPFVMIFGQANKLSAGSPFFELFLAFRDMLKACQQLFVIGYSWRDEHVNILVSTWLGAKPDRRLILVDPGKAKDHPSSFRSMIASQNPKKVQVIQKRFSEAIADISAML